VTRHVAHPKDHMHYPERAAVLPPPRCNLASGGASSQPAVRLRSSGFLNSDGTFGVSLMIEYTFAL